jgi:hypothetical protein
MIYSRDCKIKGLIVLSLLYPKTIALHTFVFLLHAVLKRKINIVNEICILIGILTKKQGVSSLNAGTTKKCICLYTSGTTNGRAMLIIRLIVNLAQLQ